MEDRFKFREFLCADEAQDLLEYTLLLAAIALAGAAVFIGMSGVVSGIWSIANNRLASANTSTS